MELKFHPFFINNYMIFNLFKHKKIEPKTYEGRFITDEEIKEMVKPKKESIFKSDVDEVNSMMNELKEMVKNGRE